MTMTSTKTYAFIFARGGSKGLPRKNVLRLAGVPLVAHSITMAQNIQRVSKIYVSTDDSEIKQIAEEYGAFVIDRPAHLCTDTSPELLSWRHAVEYVESNDDDFDVFLSLPATSPLRNMKDVNACLDSLDNETDVVITVSEAARSPYFNMVERAPTGETRILLGSGGYARRQDVPPIFDITTVAYVAQKDFVKQDKALFDGVVKSVIVPKNRAIDIDDVYDFKLAEILMATEEGREKC